MNHDRMKGKAKEVEGRVLRKVGKMTGSKRTQARGMLRQAEGKFQSSLGKAKDAASRVTKRVEESQPRSEDGKVVRVKTTRTTTIKTKRR